MEVSDLTSRKKRNMAVLILYKKHYLPSVMRLVHLHGSYKILTDRELCREDIFIFECHFLMYSTCSNFVFKKNCLVYILCFWEKISRSVDGTAC